MDRTPSLLKHREPPPTINTFINTFPIISTTYNIIGDIHGRDAWKRLVDLQCVNIFVGDFFDPYQAYPFETLERNFLEITEYKKEHSQQVVLLYGIIMVDCLRKVEQPYKVSVETTE